MHHISQVKIENYKSIVHSNFPLSAYTPLVGYNNAGKTNILQALSWAIKKASLPREHFHNPEAPIIVTAEISGIDENVLNALEAGHRGKIEPLVVNGTIRIRRTQSEPNQSASGIILEIEYTDNGERKWKVNPAGIDAAITHMFPDPILIGAMENATEDVGKFAAGTTIGKLIKEIIGPVAERNAGPVAEALAAVAQKLSADGEQKDEALVTLDDQIQAELQKFFPGVTVKTHIQTPDFSDFLKSATVKIYDQQYDNATGRDASSFGHGAQRSVQIALIKCLSEIKRNAANAGRTTLLLIDEPELYLHPQAIEIVRASLARLSSEGYQVVFTTHSANMIARDDAPNALLVRRSVQHGTVSNTRLVDAVKDAIADGAHQAETLFALSNAGRVLFSERVLLAEGKTEQAILPDLFAQQFNVSLDESRLGLVALGGVDNLPKAKSVLAAMGIPTKAIVDLDFAFRSAVSAGLIATTDPAISGCKAVLARLAGAGTIAVDAEGLPTAMPGVGAARAFELMAAEADAVGHIAAIHATLLGQGIWVWTRGAIEAHLALQSKKPAAHLAFLNGCKTPGFLETLPDFVSVRSMLDWLRA